MFDPIALILSELQIKFRQFKTRFELLGLRQICICLCLGSWAWYSVYYCMSLTSLQGRVPGWSTMCAGSKQSQPKSERLWEIFGSFLKKKLVLIQIGWKPTFFWISSKLKPPQSVAWLAGTDTLVAPLLTASVSAPSSCRRLPKSPRWGRPAGTLGSISPRAGVRSTCAAAATFSLLPQLQ